MALETGTHISDLNAANPVSTDGLAQADDHLRLIKSTIKASFPNISGAMNATQAELNVLDGITATTAELNILDGVTSTAAEINILDGVTSTTAELNILDGVTATAAEINILDGVTATATEINVLDGITATTAELNHMDGVTSNVQTQIDNVGGGLLDYAMYTSSGSIAVPSDCSKLVIKASGGGGGGGGRCHRPWAADHRRRLRFPLHDLRVGCPAPCARDERTLDQRVLPVRCGPTYNLGGSPLNQRGTSAHHGTKKSPRHRGLVTGAKCF